MVSVPHERENGLLHAAACLVPDRAAPLPDASLDWRYVLRAADRQGIAPLLHAALQPPHPAAPPAVMAELHALYWQNHFRNRALLAELARLLDAAAAARVDAMPLKGAILAPLYYPTAALRPLSDLDFMLRPDDVARFTAILRECGYQEEFVRPALDARMIHPLLREWSFVRRTPDMTYVVEYRIEPLDPALGTLLACDPQLVTRLLHHADDIWTRARRDYAGRWRIAPEDLLLHVASHLATRHAGYRLLWLHDLCRISAVHADNLDWAAVAAAARGLRLHAPVFAALEAAHDRLDAPIPLDTLRPMFLGGVRHHLSLSRLDYALLAPRRAGQAGADLTREPPVQWWLLASSLLRLRGVRPYVRAIGWTLLPSRAYIAAWRSRPEDTSLRGYLSGLLLRVGIGAVSVIAIISRRARMHGLTDWCDRILRRARPFAIYRPDDADPQ
ncbi:MAG: nucleotidyltransferase family protein [Thermomicrobia bacterium]|nr:nucleotidyltransferase family protein [Thermomicrobia bacterium]